ncbi:MAG: hypothetical protein OXI24_03685 [Candidatus Poribacteria bacterium]|nr:hypothetical protein [Candidatus Poribacteria bacterium]
MKTILVLLMFFCIITLPTFAELTIQDIEKIDAKIKESETRIMGYVNASETRITENTNKQIEGIISSMTWLIGLFVAMIALIGIPMMILTVMVTWRSTRDNTQERINQELREEIALLKQRQIVGP